MVCELRSVTVREAGADLSFKRVLLDQIEDELDRGRVVLEVQLGEFGRDEVLERRG